MNALRWHLHGMAAALGLPGLAALALGAALLADHWLVQEPAERRLTDLLADQQRLEAQLRAGPARPAAASASPQALLADFETRFSDDRHITAALSRMRSIAARNGIALERGEFKIQGSADEPLTRYVMVLPLKAEYRALRRFLRELLRAEPAIALEEVSLRRDDAKSPTVEVQLRLVLFVGPERG